MVPPRRLLLVVWCAGAFVPTVQQSLKTARRAQESILDKGFLLVNDGEKQILQRLELPYDDACEALLESWKERASEATIAHDRAGYHFKSLHRRYALPPIVLNLCLAPVSLLLGKKVTPFRHRLLGNVHVPALDAILTNVSLGTLITSLLTLLAGILAGVGNFNDANTKANQHFDISARYADIFTDIETELVSPLLYHKHNYSGQATALPPSRRRLPREISAANRLRQRARTSHTQIPQQIIRKKKYLLSLQEEEEEESNKGNRRRRGAA